MFSTLLVIDVVITYLYIFVFKIAAEQNPLLIPIIYTQHGIWVMLLMKLLLAFFVSGVSYHTYVKLHDDSMSIKMKNQTKVIEKGMWYLLIGVMGVLNILLLLSVNGYFS